VPRLTPHPNDAAQRVLLSHERRTQMLELARSPVPLSTLPANPVAGQHAVLTHATGVWELLYNGTSWQLIGGRELFARTDAETTYSSNVYPASPQGPSVSIPRAGTYDITLECRHRHSHTAILFTAASFGPTGASNAFLVAVERASVLAAGAQLMQTYRWEAISLGVGLWHAWHRAPNGGAINTHYAFRRISVSPVAL
jgi:hypothetical protein